MEQLDQYKKILRAVSVSVEADSDGAHPAEADLFAFYQGHLAADDFSRIYPHLMACAHCQEVFSQVRAFNLPLQPGEREYNNAELYAAWDKFKVQLPSSAALGIAAEEVNQDASLPKKALAAAAGTQRWQVLTAVTAISLLSFSGLVAIWHWYGGQASLQLARTTVSVTPVVAIEKARSPEALVAATPSSVPKVLSKAHSLSLGKTEQPKSFTATRRPFSGILKLISRQRAGAVTGELPRLTLRGNQTKFSLLLDKYDSQEFSAYRVELIGADGSSQVLNQVPVEPTGLIKATFVTAGLHSGVYRVRTVGVTATSEEAPAPVEGTLELVFTRK